MTAVSNTWVSFYPFRCISLDCKKNNKSQHKASSISIVCRQRVHFHGMSLIQKNPYLAVEANTAWNIQQEKRETGLLRKVEDFSTTVCCNEKTQTYLEFPLSLNISHRRTGRKRWMRMIPTNYRQPNRCQLFWSLGLRNGIHLALHAGT